MRLSLEKQFEGVGVVLSEGLDGVMIAELIKGGLQKRAGKFKSTTSSSRSTGRRLRSFPLKRSSTS